MSTVIETSVTRLVDELLDVIRQDADVQEMFGSPARVFDSDTPVPIYPYAEVVSIEASGIESALTPGGEYRTTLAVHVRHGGRAAAAAGLDVLARAIARWKFAASDIPIALAHPIYLDVMRSRNTNVHRGLLRLRIVVDAGGHDD